jgi:transposase InsO family protein
MKVVHLRLAGETGGCQTTNRRPEPQMNIHQNARLTPQGRLLMVRRIDEEGWRVAAAAAAAGLSVRRTYHWPGRYRAGGERMRCDRSSAPARYRAAVPAERVAEIERRRWQRLTGPQIARQLAMPRSTVGAVLRRRGLGRLKALDPPPPARRYERDRPGELIHIDTKKLGRIDGIGHRITGSHAGVNRNRGIGWDVLHVCIDDASRLAYTEILPDEQKASAIAFLDHALAWFARHGVAVARVMTDNGSAYRSHAFRQHLGAASLRHIRTRPYAPRTNGKAERFIPTSLREWAYARAYYSSAERTHAMHPWIADSNHRCPHSALGGLTPAARLHNVLGFDT